ncbi:MAG: class I SAM-dependent methyltransferase, partial [Gammaproteobacteria bacterium]|nr:class I SAM-dependent methyltransferase [Gammaproteobacteria bacterium]
MIDRRQHWEQVYSEKSPEAVSWYQDRPTLSLDLIHASGIARNDPIIDVGGGASVLVDYLLSEGYANVAVLDISSRALDSARKRLGAVATQTQWLTADITAFTPPHRFALWHDRAVFHFLTEPADRA